LPALGERRESDLRGLVGMVFGLSLVVLGFMMLGSSSLASALFGGFFISVGLMIVVFVVGWFRGLPYRHK